MILLGVGEKNKQTSPIRPKPAWFTARWELWRAESENKLPPFRKCRRCIVSPADWPHSRSLQKKRPVGQTASFQPTPHLFKSLHSSRCCSSHRFHPKATKPHHLSLSSSSVWPGRCCNIYNYIQTRCGDKVRPAAKGGADVTAALSHQRYTDLSSSFQKYPGGEVVTQKKFMWEFASEGSFRFSSHTSWSADLGETLQMVNLLNLKTAKMSVGRKWNLAGAKVFLDAVIRSESFPKFKPHFAFARNNQAWKLSPFERKI